MTAFLKSNLRRLALVLAIALSAAALVFASASDREKLPAIDPDQYAYLMSFKVENIYDLEQYFVLHQYDFLLIAPPFADFVLSQSGIPEVIPFDEKSFPEKFAANLVGAHENSVPVYPLTVIEDPKTRETIFYNADGKASMLCRPRRATTRSPSSRTAGRGSTPARHPGKPSTSGNPSMIRPAFNSEQS